ncbi:MAG: hypothetical protein ACOVO1_11325 [Chitinophagaceae bacterium]
MFLSKHHYAIELAKYGNEVYYLNPTNTALKNGFIEITQSNVHPNLRIINHSLPFTKKIKFKWQWLYYQLVKYHIKNIKKHIGKEIDIVWSFDLGNYFPFTNFPSSFKIFCPVDMPRNEVALRSAQNANVIISIAKEILEKYKSFGIPQFFVHHGLAEDFINTDKIQQKTDNKIRIGLSGNWLRKDIDKLVLLKIIAENPTIIFEFWGIYSRKESNIGGGSDADAKEFIEALSIAKNVIMHGTANTKQLATEYQRMDGFLICYNILKDQSSGVNYHKIMEYLSTGKVVISNNIRTYQSLQNLVEMSQNRDNNDDLVEIFTKIINNIEYYNQPDLSKKRIEFALENAYSNKIKEIEALLDSF